LREVNSSFQSKFTYSTWQGFDRLGGTNDTPLSRFLLRSRSGHCEYFATATVLLLRQLGIPARYAVGYAVHEASGKKYVVRERDAHAWCLVWNEEKGLWEDFDTTPGSWVEAEAKPGALAQFLSDLWSRIKFEFAKFRWGQTHLRQYFLWALVPILGLLFYQIVFRRRLRHEQKQNAAGGKTAWPGLDSEFYELEKCLTQQGLERAKGEPLAEWLRRALTAPHLASMQESFNGLLRLHYRYRFDPLGLKPAEREDLRRHAKECVAKVQEQ